MVNKSQSGIINPQQNIKFTFEVNPKKKEEEDDDLNSAPLLPIHGNGINPRTGSFLRTERTTNEEYLDPEKAQLEEVIAESLLLQGSKIQNNSNMVQESDIVYNNNFEQCLDPVEEQLEEVIAASLSLQGDKIKNTSNRVQNSDIVSSKDNPNEYESQLIQEAINNNSLMIEEKNQLDKILEESKKSFDLKSKDNPNEYESQLIQDAINNNNLMIEEKKQLDKILEESKNSVDFEQKLRNGEESNPTHTVNLNLKPDLRTSSGIKSDSYPTTVDSSLLVYEKNASFPTPESVNIASDDLSLRQKHFLLKGNYLESSRNYAHDIGEVVKKEEKLRDKEFIEKNLNSPPTWGDRLTLYAKKKKSKFLKYTADFLSFIKVLPRSPKVPPSPELCRAVKNFVRGNVDVKIIKNLQSNKYNSNEKLAILQSRNFLSMIVEAAGECRRLLEATEISALNSKKVKETCSMIEAFTPYDSVLKEKYDQLLTQLQ